MMDFVQQIGCLIKKYAAQSRCIDIAVALASQTAVNILSNIPKKCKVRFIVGIDLPTKKEVLEELMNSYGHKARIYKSEMFHPKVYLFHLMDDTKKLVLGSGNFTNGGLYKNIEASVLIEDSDVIAKVEKWFNGIYINSQPITVEFLKRYAVYANNESKNSEKKKARIRQFLSEIDMYTEVREEAVKLLIQKKRFYHKSMNNRPIVVEQLRKCTDISNGFKDFDVDTFLSIKSLGNIPPFYKSKLRDAKRSGQLATVLNMLIDESIPLCERFDVALDKETKIKGIGRNMLSKILCIYNPGKYVIINEITEQFYKQINLQPDKGLTQGEQYQFYCDFFSEICKKAGIKDMAALDALIYGIFSEKH